MSRPQLLVPFLLFALIPARSFAMGRKASPAQIADRDAVCASIAHPGALQEWKRPDMSRFKAPSPDKEKYPYELPVVFNVVNHKPSFLGGMPISERQLERQLEDARDTYHQCGIEVTLAGVHYWDAPAFLNNLTRSTRDEHYIGDRERCLFTPTFTDDTVNVYFVDGVSDPIDGLGRSHSIADYWFEPEQEGDARFVGAAIIADYDRVYGGAGDTAVPHEMGHIVFNMGHTMDQIPNIMSDSRQLLALVVRPEQCEAARSSRFVHPRR